MQSLVSDGPTKIAIPDDIHGGTKRFFHNKAILTLESQHTIEEVLEWIREFDEE